MVVHRAGRRRAAWTLTAAPDRRLAPDIPPISPGASTGRSRFTCKGIPTSAAFSRLGVGSSAAKRESVTRRRLSFEYCPSHDCPAGLRREIMKRRVASLSIVVVIALALYFAYRIRRGPSELEWSGTVEAHTIEVGSRVGGRVQEVSVREGDAVVAGQPLVTLEKGDLPAQRLIALGQLEQARGVLEKVASRTRPTARRAELAEAQARLQAEQALEEKAKLDDGRAQKLFKEGAGTRVDSDNAALALRTATAQVAAQRAQAETILHGTPEDVRSGQGMVDAAQGRLQQIDVMLAELVIRAPRASRVESLDLRPGDILAPNATAARLLEPSELF